MREPRPRQVVGLDVMRLFAALAVVFYHYGYQTSVPGFDAYRYSHGLISYPDLAPFARFGWMGVPAFFVISGFVISFSASSARPSDFLAARILRLAPAVWICAPLTAICIYLSGVENVPHILGRLFNSMTFFPLGSQIDGVYWTLRIEVFFYGAVFLYLYLGRYSLFSRYICALAVVSTVFNLLLALGHSSIDIGGIWTDLLLVRHGCEFAFGALVYAIYKDGLRIDRLIFGAIALAGCFLQVVPGFQQWLDVPEFFIWSSFVVLFLSIVVSNKLLLSICSPRALKAIRQVGKATYPIYLVHQIVGVFLLYLLVSAGTGPYQALVAVVLFMLALTAVICALEERLRNALRAPVSRLFTRKAVAIHREEIPEAV